MGRQVAAAGMHVEAVTGSASQLLADLLAAELPGPPPPAPPAASEALVSTGSTGAPALASTAGDSEAPGPTGATVPPISCPVIIALRPAADEQPTPVADPADVDLLAGYGVDLPRRLVRTQATGSRAELTWIDLETDEPISVVVLGLGPSTPADLRRAAAVMARRLRGMERCLVLATRDLDAEQLRAFAEGLVLPTAAATWVTTPPPAPPRLVRLAVGEDPQLAEAVALGVADGAATLQARRLIHTPSNIKDPAWVERQVGELAADSGLDVRVWGPDELARDGFGGILAVGAGSVRPPRLIQLDAGGRGRSRAAQRHVVLVGKGITFDSGGLSLKPPDMQIPMKTDMSGAAVVAAVLAALGPRLGEEVRVTGLLALAENLPGAAAMRPGDVVTHHGGLSSEVVNTDAEGRLVLGDALDFAVRDLAADVVVDVATLTGAATLGLGRRYAALYSTSDALAAALTEAGEAAGELMWRMPLHSGYVERIASTVADQANADTQKGPGPGSITAALFLHRFVGDTPWAHLDIAGVGRSDAEREEVPKGGTGFGVRALLRWIEAGAVFS